MSCKSTTALASPWVWDSRMWVKHPYENSTNRGNSNISASSSIAPQFSAVEVGRSNSHFDAPKNFGMSTTLPLYWNLSSHTKQERIDASEKLIRAIQCFQRDFQPPPEVKFNAKTSIDAFNTQDASYGLKRLARGLGSPRESSRLGFAVALTEVHFDRRVAR